MTCGSEQVAVRAETVRLRAPRGFYCGIFASYAAVRFRVVDVLRGRYDAPEIDARLAVCSAADVWALEDGDQLVELRILSRLTPDGFFGRDVAGPGRVLEPTSTRPASVSTCRSEDAVVRSRIRSRTWEGPCTLTAEYDVLEVERGRYDAPRVRATHERCPDAFFRGEPGDTVHLTLHTIVVASAIARSGGQRGGRGRPIAVDSDGSTHLVRGLLP